MINLEKIPFRQARHFRHGRRDPATGLVCRPRVIVIHTAEISESLQGAEALMNVCATSERVASWHYAVDADSVTQSVKVFDTAFHAPGISHASIGIEHAGRARQTAVEWADDFSLRMLKLSADLVAALASSYMIPLARLSDEELRSGAAGIVGHADVSRVFKRSTHWDPGPAFPWSYYLRLALESVPAMPELGLGSVGVVVETLQRRLNLHLRSGLLDDGDFGKKTKAAVIEFQAYRGLEDTGVVDDATWRLLLGEPSSRGTAG